MPRIFPAAALCLTLAAIAGCATTSWWERRPANDRADARTSDEKQLNASTNADNPSTPAANAHPDASAARTSGDDGTSASGDPQELQQVMAELKQLGDLDPTTQQQLMADLEQTDPALWPALLHQARAMVAYRHRHAEGGPAGVTATGGTSVADKRMSGVTVAEAQRPIDPPPASPQYAPSSPAYGNAVEGTNPPGRSAVAPDAQPRPVDRLPAANSAALPPGETPDARYPATTSPSIEATLNDEPAAPELHWRDHLLSAIERLEHDAERPTDNAERSNRYARLRMLYLAADRLEDAVRPIPSAGPARQAFWSHEMQGLGTLLSSPASWDAAGRLAEAQGHLNRALAELSETAPLVVRNLTFCTAVHSYGCVEPFQQFEFQPEQRVLLYAEVENFGTEETADGFHTSLRSSYQIFDSRGHRVADRDLTATEEVCRNRRRDFFIVYDFHLPKRIFPGKHTLRLTVEDLKSQKIGQSSVELVIKESP